MSEKYATAPEITSATSAIAAASVGRIRYDRSRRLMVTGRSLLDRYSQSYARKLVTA